MSTESPEVEVLPITSLVPDDQNANQGTLRGAQLLHKSLENLGAGRSVLLDRKRKLIAGNKTSESALDLGFEQVIVVHTTGKQIVAVQRDDLDLDDPADERARALAIADNRVGEVNLDWNADEIARLQVAQPAALEEFFFPDEVADLIERDGKASSASLDTDRPLEGEVESLWPEIKLRVPRETLDAYQEMQRLVDGDSEHARFAKILDLANRCLDLDQEGSQ